MATIKGKWRWNDVVNCDYQAHNEYHLNFESNKIKFDALKLEWYVGKHELYYRSLNDKYYILAGISANSGDDFYSVKEEYRVMDFGETEQEINDELYEFILANATEYSPIAEKLVEVANNVQKVFEAGKQQGHGEGYDSGYDAGLEAGKEIGGYNEGFEEGKKKEQSDFWDIFQNYGSESGMSYNEVFGKGRFTDANYNPKYPIQVVEGTNSGYAMFNGAGNITDIKVPIYHRGTNLGYLFNACRTLKRIPALHMLAEVTNFQSAFYHCLLLEDITITGTIGENIDFQWSKKLTRASIESILNALSDTATGKTLTLSNDAVYEAFALRDDDGNKLPYLEGIWQEYIYIKSNWTITLV